MLNTNEIRDIESKWKRYKRKIYLKYFLLLSVAVVIIGLFLFFQFSHKLFDANNEKNATKQTVKPFRQDVKKVSNIKKDKIEKRVKQEKAQKPKREHIKKVKTVKSVNDSNKDQAVVLSLNRDFINNIYKSYEKNVTKKSNIKKPTVQQTYKQIKDARSNIESKTGKKKIVISSQKIDKLKYLQNRFEDTGKVFYAISLSKEYYKRGEYKKSLEWSINANNIDSQNEESWIMFAKSKVKLHKKIDAINALQAYLKINSSKRVKILLSNIRAGIFK